MATSDTTIVWEFQDGQVRVSEPHVSSEQMRAWFDKNHIRVNTGVITRKPEKLDPTKTQPIEGVYEKC